MKKFKLLMVVCFLSIAATASAQFANSSSSSSSSEATAWQGLRVSYLPISIEEASLSGFQIGYVKSFGVSSNIPLFIEVGANLLYTSGNDLILYEYDYSYVEEDVKLNYFSLSVPVNFGYQFKCSETISLFPYAGITLRGNLFGNYKVDGESLNAFDEDEAGEFKLNRFQIGWQIGIGATFNRFFVGTSYGTDFSEIIDGGSLSAATVTVGFNF